MSWTALSEGQLYCNEEQQCGARYVYYSFHPKGAWKLLWDPTKSGRRSLGGGGAK